MSVKGMNMQKLLIALAGVALVGFSTYAENRTWFNGGITADWPNATGMNGTWSNVTDQATLKTPPAVEIEADDATPLTFIAATTQTLGPTRGR